MIDESELIDDATKLQIVCVMRTRVGTLVLVTRFVIVVRCRGNPIPDVMCRDMSRALSRVPRSSASVLSVIHQYVCTDIFF